MKKIALFLAVVIAGTILAGCAPEISLFPLFVNSDQEFDERLVGEWRLQEGSTFKPGEESGRIVFRKSGDGPDYEVTLFDFDEKGLNLALTARLIRLGSSSFIDFGTPDIDKRKFTEIPFPSVGGHMFGRFHLDKSGARMDFLNDDWVEKQEKAGTFALATVQTSNGLVISASTEELRKFALGHGEDANVFAQHYSLNRTK